MAKAKAAAKKPSKASVKKLTKAGLIGAIHEQLGDEGLSKSQIKAILETLVEVGQKEHRDAKPGSRTVRARPIKALKDSVN